LRSFSERKNAETRNEYQGDGFARFMITFQRRHKAGTGRLKEVLAPLHDASGRKGGLAARSGCPYGRGPERGEWIILRFFSIGVKVLGKILMSDARAVFAKKILLKKKTALI
jgi:hypothetical protein